MKEKALKALFVAIAVALGITLVTLVEGEGFSLVKTGLYGFIAFVVDFGVACFFEKKK